MGEGAQMADEAGREWQTPGNEKRREEIASSKTSRNDREGRPFPSAFLSGRSIDVPPLVVVPLNGDESTSVLWIQAGLSHVTCEKA
jgi:hypothetical protein